MRLDFGKLQESFKPLYLPGKPGGTDHPTIQPILDTLAIQPDDVIVEIGAGDGRFSMPITRQLKKAGGSGVVFARGDCPGKERPEQGLRDRRQRLKPLHH
jgi:hypothetical protein